MANIYNSNVWLLEIKSFGDNIQWSQDSRQPGLQGFWVLNDHFRSALKRKGEINNVFHKMITLHPINKHMH